MAINPGQGTIVKMTISSTLTVVAQVVEGSGGGITVPKVKTTNLASVTQVFRAGLPEGEEFSFTIQYDPTNAQHEAIIAAAASWPQVPVNWEVIFNTAAGTDNVQFSCFVTKFSPKGMNQDDNLEADVSIQPVTIGTFT